MPAFTGAQVNIGGGEPSATPAPTPTPTKTSGAFGGLDVKIGGTATSSATPPVAQQKSLPIELPQPKKENIFQRTFDTMKSGIESLTGSSKPKGAKSMEFPVMTTDLKPQDLDARLKDLDKRQSEITAARTNVDLNDQKSIDEYNAKVSKIENDSETYNKDADTLNAVAKAHQALGISLYPGIDKNQSTIGPDIGGGVEANEFENARMKAGYPSWAVRNSFTKIVDPIIGDSLNKISSFVKTLDSSPVRKENAVFASPKVAPLVNTVINTFPFTSSAKGYLAGLNYDDKNYKKTGQIVSSNKLPGQTIQGGEFDTDTKNIFIDTGNKKTPLDQQQIVATHEMLNALYPKSVAAQNPDKFNSDWENLKKNGSPEIKQALADIDKHMSGLGYEKLGPYTLSTSRFSYLAQESKDDIPTELQKYYSGVIDFNPQKQEGGYTPAQRFGAGLEAVAGVGNALFAPISGIVGVAAQKSQLVGIASQILSLPGQLASTVTGMAVASLPISEQTKSAISPGLQDIASLITDILTAEKAGKEITPEIREKIGMVKDKIVDVQTKITKDIVTQHTPGGTVYFDAAKVKDIWQTSKLLTDSEKSDVLGVIGGDKAKLKDSLKNGISIEISPRELVMLQDKPYWAKIKKYFGIESADKIVSDIGATARQTVRGYLPAAGASSYSPALHPSLKEDLVDALGTHDAETIKNELVAQLHVNPIKADAIVRKIQQEQAMKDPNKLAQDVLQLAAPESRMQIEGPKAFGGSKIEINKTAEEKAIEEKVIKGIKENGGITINTSGSEPTKGFSYAPAKDSEFSAPEEDFHANAGKYYDQFYEKNKEILSDPGNHIGGWVENGRVYLDISRVGDASAETIAKAQAAKQLGVYDLENGKTIHTGQLAENGSGEYTPIDEATNVYDKHQREISGANKEGGTGGSEKIQPHEETGGGASSKLKPVGGGEKVASELASGIEARAIEKKLTDKPFSSLSMHERAVMEDQRSAATKFYKTDPEKAKAVALGEANAPEGMLPSVIYQKVVEEAEKAGDIDFSMRLATSPFNDEITAMAQNIRGLAEFRNKTSPTAIIKKVTGDRRAAVEKKTKKAGIEETKKKIVERGKRTIAKKKSPIQLKDVEEFINLLEC